MSQISYLIQKTQLFPQDLEIVSDDFTQWTEIALLGEVSAGIPIDLFTQNKRIRVPSTVVRKESYALKVKGDSMIDENIHDGDVIIVKSQTHADNGQSVVALINGEQTTLKKFYVEKDGIRLQPANPAMEPIYLTHDQVQILGIVQCILRIPQ